MLALNGVVQQLFVVIGLLFISQFSFSCCSVIIAGPSNITTDEGNDVMLECRTSSSNVTVTIEWMKNNVTLNMTSSRYSIYDNNTLTIHNATHESGDAGKYECVVMNGSVILERSQPAFVYIRFLKIYLPAEKFVNRKLYIGRTMTRFSALWEAYPKPDVISWKPPSDLVPTDNMTFQSTSNNLSAKLRYTGKITLTLSNVNSPIYNGNYTVFLNTTEFQQQLIFGNLEIIGVRPCATVPPLFTAISHGSGQDACPVPYMACSSRKECFPLRDYCDNLNDCGDWSDEANCSLPRPPRIVSIYHVGYSTIRLGWKLEKQNKSNSQRIRNATTVLDIYTVKATEKKIAKTLFYHDGVEGISKYERITGLQNGTTYLIELRTKIRAGISVNATSANVTIPRMVAPSAPRNMSIKVRSTFTSIWLTISYKRPSDDGGTDFLSGFITKCLVQGDSSTHEGNGNVKLIDCKESRVILGKDQQGDESFYYLKGNTRYYFSIYFQSNEDQDGPKAFMFYKTPPTKTYTIIGAALSDAAIAGIVIGCAIVFFITVFGFYKALNKSQQHTSTSVAYYPK